MAASLEALIERIRRAPSPLLRRALARAKIEPVAFAAADLARLPPIEPAEISLDALDDPVGHLRLADAPPPVRLGTARFGGATVVLSWTARDLARQAEAGARLFRLAGAERGWKIANTLDGGFATPGSLAVGDAVEALGALDVPLGPARDDAAARAAYSLLERVEVDALVFDAASAASLLPLLDERPPRGLRLGLELGVARRPPLSVSVRRWLSAPGASVFAAVECGSARFHVDPDVRADVEGDRILLSALAGDAPILRFDVAIRGRAVETCGCGLPGVALELGS
jgi:hypothetical protein